MYFPTTQNKTNKLAMLMIVFVMFLRRIIGFVIHQVSFNCGGGPEGNHLEKSLDSDCR